MQQDRGVNDIVPTMTARAILFDMDGTLVSSIAVVEAVWTEFAEEFGLDRDTVISEMHGIQAVDTVRRFAPEGTDIAAVTAGILAKEMTRTDGIVAIPGSLEFVASLPASAIALVTSAARELAMLRTTVAGFTEFGVAICDEDIERGKPAPDCYLAAAKALGVAPEDVIVFEDAPAGIAAALAAGMRTIVVGSAGGPVAEGLPTIADYTDLRAEVSVDPDGGAVIAVSLGARGV
jgi:sugar-phosphatase